MKLLKISFPFIFLFVLFSCQPVEESRKVKEYSIEEFYGNTKVNGGTFSNDESKLLINSNETGIFNVYEIDIKTGMKVQLTSSNEESFYSIDYVPGKSDFIYSADKGGNEIAHIFLQTEEGQTTDLTPGESEKASVIRWSADKKSLIFSSNKRDPKFFDIYKMSIADWEPNLIFQNDDGYQLEEISDNENLIALSQSITTSQNRLFLLDKEQNKKVEISVEEGNYSASGFSKDNAHFYYTTDVGKEFTYLVQYEVSSGDKKVLFESDWDVRYSYLSENETFRVIALNEDGKNSLVVLDNKTNAKVDFPEIPDGDILAVRMAKSEKIARLTIGTSRGPSNIYTYNFETKDLKKLTNTLNPALDQNDLVSAEVVRYKSFDGVEIPAIYYKPHTASVTNKVPALVWVHGGPGGQSRVGYFALIQYLVNHGYAILAVNNRGSSGYGKTFYKMDDKNHGDKDLKDCIWGKKWLQDQNYIDQEKIGIMGGSYGGYMTMAAMSFTPEEFKVGVNLFGVTNWLRTLKSIPPYWESFRKALYAELGDPTTADSVRLYDISPLFHADKIKNPIMVLQGANDPRVLKVESDEIVEAVKKSGVPVEYVVFPDEGHGFVKKENEIKGYGKVLEFLDKYLIGESESNK